MACSPSTYPWSDECQARVALCRRVHAGQVHHAARISIGGHRESARSDDADGEGAEVDSDEPVSKVQITEYTGYIYGGKGYRIMGQ